MWYYTRTSYSWHLLGKLPYSLLCPKLTAWPTVPTLYCPTQCFPMCLLCHTMPTLSFCAYPVLLCLHCPSVPTLYYPTHIFLNFLPCTILSFTVPTLYSSTHLVLLYYPSFLVLPILSLLCSVCPVPMLCSENLECFPSQLGNASVWLNF